MNPVWPAAAPSGWPRWTIAGLVGAIAASLAGNPATGQVRQPVAIVEDATSGMPVAVFDYLRPGDRIAVPAAGRVVIGYLRSCRLETITGGEIVIGETESTVRGGEVSARRADCDGGVIEFGTGAATSAGVTVYRAGDEPDRLIYSATPVFLAGPSNGAGPLRIERLDRPEPRREVPLVGGRIDLAAAGLAINPGGDYRATLGKREVTFRVVVYARPGGPLVGRLIVF